LKEYSFGNLSSILISIISTVEDLTTNNFTYVRDFIRKILNDLDKTTVFSILWSLILKIEKTSLFVLKYISEIRFEQYQFEEVFPSIESTVYNALKKCIDNGSDEILILSYKVLKLIVNPNIEID